MNNSVNEKVYYSICNTSFTDLFIASTEKGLCCVSFMDNSIDKQINWLQKYFQKNNIIENETINSEASRQLMEYFEGNRREFNLKLNLMGTAFQKRVWNILIDIKYGEVWTYKDVALKIGDVKKSRAVGGAVGKNPVAIIIPCHRVIGSNGKLTGFSAPGGIELKRKLLDLEKSHNL